MSVDHFIYAEVRIGSKWYGLNPKVQDFVTGEIKVFPYFEGKSYLEDTYDRLIEDSCCFAGLPDNLSEELTKVLLAGSEFVDDFWRGEKVSRKDYVSRFTHWVKYDLAVREEVLRYKKVKQSGYVLKSALPEFELGEIYDLHWLTKKEYNQLDEDEKTDYVFYEWDYTSRWFNHFESLVQQIDMQLYWTRENAYLLMQKGVVEYEDLMVGPGDVRLIIQCF